MLAQCYSCHVSASLSVTSRYGIWYRNYWRNRAGFWHAGFLFTYPTESKCGIAVFRKGNTARPLRYGNPLTCRTDDHTVPPTEIPAKIKVRYTDIVTVLLSGTFPRTLDLENFATMVDGVVNKTRRLSSLWITPMTVVVGRT